MKIIESKFLCLITMTLLVIIAGNTQLVSQNGVQMSVSGTVRHADTGQPMEDVEVSIVSIYYNTVTGASFGVTDSNGYYKVKYLNAGEHKLSFNIPGKSTAIFPREPGEKDPYEFFIEEGINVNIDIQLGESEYPYITRDESMDGANICMTVYNCKEPETPAADKIPTATGSATERSTKERQTSTANPQMTPNATASAAATKGSSKIIDTIEIGKFTLLLLDGGISMVPDKQAPKTFSTGKQGNCRYTVQKRGRAACFKVPPGCDFVTLDGFKITMKLTIQISSEAYLRTFLENSYPNNVFSAEKIRCKWKCLLTHEETHKADAIQIAKTLFQKLVNDFNENKCCPSDCQTLLMHLYEIFKGEFSLKYAATETHAVLEQKACEYTNDCNGK